MGDTCEKFIDGMKDIEEINMEIGLRRFSGMKDIFYSTLEMFYKKILSECNKMTSFLDARDIKNFMISVHTMKSSLATIGAMRLSETASELETSSKNQDFDSCVRQFPEFKEKLLALHTKLSVIYSGGEIYNET